MLTILDQNQDTLYDYLETALAFTPYNEYMNYVTVYTIEDFHEDDMANAFAEVSDFTEKFKNIVKNQSYDMISVGGDFWLSRNNLGEGFTSDVYGDYSDELYNLAQSYGRQQIVEIEGKLRLC